MLHACAAKCDGESEKFCKVFWELTPKFKNFSRFSIKSNRVHMHGALNIDENKN
jgi:hypothetical protein